MSFVFPNTPFFFLDSIIANNKSTDETSKSAWLLFFFSVICSLPLTLPLLILNSFEIFLIIFDFNSFTLVCLSVDLLLFILIKIQWNFSILGFMFRNFPLPSPFWILLPPILPTCSSWSFLLSTFLELLILFFIFLRVSFIYCFFPSATFWMTFFPNLLFPPYSFSIVSFVKIITRLSYCLFTSLSGWLLYVLYVSANSLSSLLFSF